MQKHTKIYLESRGLWPSDTILCEKCGKVAVDIHHIEPKGIGGNPDADRADNLIALCRGCHNRAHGIKGDQR